jgi:murein DD-endopeptidase MepM/ murein hydrolase activator NlpD
MKRFLKCMAVMAVAVAVTGGDGWAQSKGKAPAARPSGTSSSRPANTGAARPATPSNSRPQTPATGSRPGTLPATPIRSTGAVKSATPARTVTPIRSATLPATPTRSTGAVKSATPTRTVTPTVRSATLPSGQARSTGAAKAVQPASKQSGGAKSAGPVAKVMGSRGGSAVARIATQPSRGMIAPPTVVKSNPIGVASGAALQKLQKDWAAAPAKTSESGGQTWVVTKGKLGDVLGKNDKVVATFKSLEEARKYANDANNKSPLGTLFQVSEKSNSIGVTNQLAPSTKISPALLGLPENNKRNSEYGVARVYKTDSSGNYLKVQPQGYPHKVDKDFKPGKDERVKPHLGIDISSRDATGKVAQLDFKGGVTGKVVAPIGGKYGTITVELANKTRVQYLHTSQQHVRVGDDVTPDTVLGRTGSTGANAIHLHVQARDSRNELIDPDSVLETSGPILP